MQCGDLCVALPGGKRERCLQGLLGLERKAVGLHRSECSRLRFTSSRGRFEVSMRCAWAYGARDEHRCAAVHRAAKAPPAGVEQDHLDRVAAWAKVAPQPPRPGERVRAAEAQPAPVPGSLEDEL